MSDDIHDGNCADELTLMKIVVGMRFLLALWILNVLTKLRNTISVNEGMGTRRVYVLTL